MRSLTPRRRRAAVMAGTTSSITAAMLPVQQHFAHGRHPAAFGIAYISIIVVLLSVSVRELIKARQEEGCDKA